MRVLWLTNSPSNYLSDGFGYNGCGWISSLENAIKTEVELGVAFVMNGQESKVEKNGVTYYLTSCDMISNTPVEIIID